MDGMGSAYVTGSTSSRDFPTTPGAFDRNCGPTCGFAVMLAVEAGRRTPFPAISPTPTAAR